METSVFLVPESVRVIPDFIPTGSINHPVVLFRQSKSEQINGLSQKMFFVSIWHSSKSSFRSLMKGLYDFSAFFVMSRVITQALAQDSGPRRMQWRILLSCLLTTGYSGTHRGRGELRKSGCNHRSSTSVTLFLTQYNSDMSKDHVVILKPEVFLVPRVRHQYRQCSPEPLLASTVL